MSARWVRLWFAGLLLGFGLLGSTVPIWAEYSAQDFDQWYYATPTPPDARQNVEALNYFIHLTGTATALFPSEKDYRLFVAARARFFAVLGQGEPAFWRHAESLFPQCFWSQKSLLLEIFKRTREPSVAENLGAWARSEDDDDRRLILEEAALSGSAPETILEKPLSSPQILAEQWAVFFASGNTAVVEASLRFLRRNPDRNLAGNSGKATGESLQSAGAVLREAVWEKLDQFSRIYPRVRQAFQAGLLSEPLTGTDLKRALEALAWQDLDAGDTLGAQALLPLVETLWSKETAQRDLFKGELAVINHQPGEVEAAGRRLAGVEPMWAERLAAFQAHDRWLQASAGRTWGAAESGGEKYGHLGAQYLGGLKTWRTADFFRLQPALVSWDEKVIWREQVKSVQMPQRFKGWRGSGHSQSNWKIENGFLYLWNGQGGTWAEVRDPEVRERILKAATLDLWVDLLNRQIPKETRENNEVQPNRVQLLYETQDYAPGQIWEDTTHFWTSASPEGNKVFMRLTVELSKIDGRVDEIIVEIPDANGRTCRMEKIFFDQNFTIP